MAVVNLTEQVSEDVFKAFKEEVLRGFDNVNKNISELVGEIRTYSRNLQDQSEKLAVHENQLKELENLKITVDNQGKQLIKIETEHKTGQRNLATIFTIVALLLTAVSICIALFK